MTAHTDDAHQLLIACNIAAALIDVSGPEAARLYLAAVCRSEPLDARQVIDADVVVPA